MKIRPKSILFAATGVKFTQQNANGINWRQQVFDKYRLHILDTLSADTDDYGYWLNEMLGRHANIYKLAGGKNGNWQNIAYQNDLVGQYQHDYKGDLRFGSFNPGENYDYDFNQSGIKSALNFGRYDTSGPTRTSGDYNRGEYNYKVDNLYSAITDDRRLLGRFGDWDDASLNEWNNQLKNKGWEMFLDKDDYYKLRRISNKSLNTPPLSTEPETVGTELVIDPNKQQDWKIRAGETGDPEEKPSFWNKLNTNFKSIAPDLLEALRLAGTLHTNDRVYDEMKKAIIPNLLLSYNTHRQVVGDEATKLAYYRRAVQGLTKAAQPFTSDADRQMAYMQEAKRVGDELRALGDLVDNQEIRRTSDESNQHLWGNIQRATEVANNNITELNKAFAAKRQLAAQKKLADWTNIDLFLLGRISDYKQKKARNLNYAELLLLLLDLHEIATDETLLRLKTEAESAYNDYYKDTTDLAKYSFYRSKLKAYLDYLYELQKRILTRRAQLSKGTLFGKSGVKLTYKDNTGKQLYKISKDIADHFRRISKMTDDSRVRTLPKPIKLSSHPKKMLMGGVAPFYIYRPYGMSTELSMSVSQDTSSKASSSSSSKDTAGKDKLDMVKELFKAIQGQGLPVDVNSVYLDITSVLNKAKAFGEELSTDDIASMYLNSMLKINNLKYSKDVFDKAKALATANEALNEFAVTTGGKLVLQDIETGKVKSGTYQEFIESEGKLNPLTNDLLLNLRAYSPNMALWKGDEMMQIVNNGVGMNKIADLILKLASKLGSSEEKIEGISEVQAHKIKNGLLTIAGFDNTPDGFYKISKDIKDSSSNVQAALNYIMTVLPPNYKTLLDLRSGGKAKDAILSILTSLTSDYYKEDIAPLTGNAAKGSGSGSEKEGSDITPAIALSMGLGERETFVISDKTSDGLKVQAVNLPLLDLNHHAMAAATLLQVGNGDYAGLLLLNSATMGGVKVSPEGINDILISEGRIHAAELPIDMATYLSTGIIKPNLNFLKNIEKADELVKQAGITNRDNLTAEQIKVINNIYSQNNLPIIYTIDSNGKPILTSEYRRFALMKATAPKESFEEDLTLNDGAIEATDDDRTRFESMMKQVTGNNKYSLDNGISIPGIGRITGTDLYKGILYVPMTESHISALASTGYKASPEEYNLIDALDQQALFIRSSGFTSAGSFTK